MSLASLYSASNSSPNRTPGLYFFMCTLGVGGAKIRQGRLIFEFAKVFLEEGQILLQGLLELSFDYLAHRTAFEEGRIFKVICQFCFELE